MSKIVSDLCVYFFELKLYLLYFEINDSDSYAKFLFGRVVLCLKFKALIYRFLINLFKENFVIIKSVKYY